MQPLILNLILQASLLLQGLAAALEFNLNDDANLLQKMAQLNKYYSEQDWNATTAQAYLNELIERHGPKIKKDIEEFGAYSNAPEDSSPSAEESQSKSHSEIEWKVGEMTLTKFDQPVFQSTVARLKSLWPSLAHSLDKWQYEDLGVYLLSFRDTNIFDNIEDTNKT